MLTSRQQQWVTVVLWLSLMLNVGLAAYLFAEGIPVYVANLSAGICVGATLWLRRWIGRTGREP